MSTLTAPLTGRFTPVEGHAVKVLVAEPSVSISTRLVATLRGEGCDVTTTDSGEGAIARMATGGLDLVVLDVVLPGVGGVDVVRRARRAGQDVPVLFITTRDAVNVRVDCLTAGADDVVTAPVDMDELVARLTVLLRRGPSRRGRAARQGRRSATGAPGGSEEAG